MQVKRKFVFIEQYLFPVILSQFLEMIAEFSGKFYQSMIEDLNDNKGINVYNRILLAVN